MEPVRQGKAGPAIDRRRRQARIIDPEPPDEFSTPKPSAATAKSSPPRISPAFRRLCPDARGDRTTRPARVVTRAPGSRKEAPCSVPESRKWRREASGGISGGAERYRRLRPAFRRAWRGAGRLPATFREARKAAGRFRPAFREGREGGGRFRAALREARNTGGRLRAAFFEAWNAARRLPEGLLRRHACESDAVRAPSSGSDGSFGGVSWLEGGAGAAQ